MSSRFCEFCGSDVHVEVPTMAQPTSSASSPPSSTAAQASAAVGFNEATFNALVKILDAKGIVSIEDLQGELNK